MLRSLRLKKISNITGQVITWTLKVIENNISNIIDLVKKKTDYVAKILDIETKYFTTSDYNKFMSEILNTKIKEKGLVNKSDISNLVKKIDLNTNLTTLATKADLKTEQGKIVKLSAFRLNYFLVKNLLVMLAFKFFFVY